MRYSTDSFSGISRSSSQSLMRPVLLLLLACLVTCAMLTPAISAAPTTSQTQSLKKSKSLTRAASSLRELKQSCVAPRKISTPTIECATPLLSVTAKRQLSDLDRPTPEQFASSTSSMVTTSVRLSTIADRSSRSSFANNISKKVLPSLDAKPLNQSTTSESLPAASSTTSTTMASAPSLRRAFSEFETTRTSNLFAREDSSGPELWRFSMLRPRRFVDTWTANSFASRWQPKQSTASPRWNQVNTRSISIRVNWAKLTRKILSPM